MAGGGGEGVAANLLPVLRKPAFSTFAAGFSF